MEITDEGLGPLQIVELDTPDGLEIEDRGAQLPSPGDLVMLPGSALPTVHHSMEEEKKETDWENDQDHDKFMVYLRKRMENIPRHSGNTTVGIEKAVAFLKRLDREISKAVQGDEKNVIDESEAEELRDQICEFVAQLEEAHGKLLSSKKTNKKSSVWVGKKVIARLYDGIDFKYYIPIVRDGDEELFEVKIAEPSDEQVQKFVAGEDESGNLKKEAGSAKIHLFEDPFMHAITQIIISSHVSSGRNMQETFEHLKKKYALTPREELSVASLIREKGFPLNNDLGLMNEPSDPAMGTGFEQITHYLA